MQSEVLNQPFSHCGFIAEYIRRNDEESPKHGALRFGWRNDSMLIAAFNADCGK
jgi:hypothetical protein